MKTLFDPDFKWIADEKKRAPRTFWDPKSRRAEFLRALKNSSLSRETETRRIRERSEEKEALREKQCRDHKIKNLQSLISLLRQKLSSEGFDPSVAARLALAQSELFRLLFTI